MPGEVTISFTGTLQDFTVDVAVSNMIVQTSAKVRFVVYEKDIPYDALNGEKIFTFVVRKILNEEAVSLGAGEKVSIKRTFQPQPDWESQNLGVVVLFKKTIPSRFSKQPLLQGKHSLRPTLQSFRLLVERYLRP